MTSPSALQYLERLAEIASSIRDIESRARIRLHEAGDKGGYRELMTQKALTLVELPEEIGPVPTGQDGFDPAEARRIEAGLRDFARRAGQALDLESMFYMYALLYPEDYRDGDPNDLERFIEGVRKRAGL